MEDMIVDQIYEAGLVPELWSKMLGEFTTRFAGVGTVLIAAGHGKQQMAFSPGFDAVMSGFVEEGWHRRNQRLQRATASRLSGFMTERDLFTEEELLADPMLAGFLLPRGIGGELGTIIAVPSGDTLALTVQRRFDDGPASSRMVAEANALRPHLARAALISARIGLDRARAAADALQAIGMPAAVLTGRGHALAVNDLFEAMTPAVATEHRGRIALSVPHADNLLADAIEHLADRGVETGTRSIPIRDVATGTCTIAHLIPIRRSACDIFVGAAAILLLSPVMRPSVGDATMLEGLFDLTPAEIRLCSAIVNGSRNLPETSRKLNVSYFTVKTQLRSVFEKTGVRSQSELVSMILGLMR